MLQQLIKMRKLGKQLLNITTSPTSNKLTLNNIKSNTIRVPNQKRTHDKLAQEEEITKINLETLDSHELNSEFISTIQSLNMRQKLFKWLIAQCRLTLELRFQTIQHCMRLFDKYYIKKGTITNNLSEGQLTLISCLFISSKYEQIYPPVLTDFEYVVKYKFGGRQILSKQIQILEVIDYEITIALASSFYVTLFKERIPQWGILCYVNLPAQTKMRRLAQSIYKVNKIGFKNQSNIEQEIQRKVELVINNFHC